MARRHDDRRLPAQRFPTIWEACQTAGLDPTQEWLPVAPAAHYLSGGVVTDLDGASTLPHLWACGETACSGVHGANRLASNSLLDGLVFGRRVVAAIVAGKVGAESTGAMAGVLSLPAIEVLPSPDPVVLRKEEVTAPDALRGAVQRTMSADCGGHCAPAEPADGGRHAPRPRATRRRSSGREIATYEVINLLRVSRAIVAGRAGPPGVARSHTQRRSGADDRWLGRLVIQGDGAPRLSSSLRRWPGSVMSQFDAPESVVAEVVAAALAEDFGLLGDITSIACIGEDQTAHRRCSSRVKRGVLAGTALVDEAYRQVRGGEPMRWHVDDGESVEAGADLGEVSGSLRRSSPASVALNFLCHCSGVASLTRRYVRAARQGGSSYPARPCRACARSSGRPCAPAAASTIATR